MAQIRSYIQYFQRLANQHTDILDFFICDINEPLAELKSGIRSPALILNAVKGDFTGPNRDDTLDNIQGGFLIIKSLDKIDDFENEMIALDDMKQIGEDLIARILHDTEKCELLAAKAFPGFDFTTVKYEMMGPVFDNWWGMNFTFNLLKGVNLEYDPGKWDLTKVISGKVSY